MTMSSTPSNLIEHAVTSPDLASLLVALGHDCPQGCARASAELGAAVWLTRRGLPLPTSGSPTLVVVDTRAHSCP
jgi:hypothetical protein